MSRKVFVPVILVILVATAPFADAKRRDVKAIGQAALRKGVISSTKPKGRDFTKIDPNASYKPGELMVRFAPVKVKGKLSAITSAKKKPDSEHFKRSR